MGCSTEGAPVYWGSDCVTVSVQADGAARAGVDYAAGYASLERAAAAWNALECPGGGKPSIRVEVAGPVTCGASEYNPKKRNANVLVFRDEAWPYEMMGEDALGLTRLHFDPDSGELYDADIELNAVAEPLSVGDPADDEVDLDSLISHELGHLLGLGHSRDLTATMMAGYQPGSIELRIPGRDDARGLCEIYPPDREPSSHSCDARHGFSELCGAEQPDTVAADPEEPPAGEAPATSAGCAMSRGHEPALPGGALALLAWSLVTFVRRRGRVTASEACRGYAAGSRARISTPSASGQGEHVAAL